MKLFLRDTNPAVAGALSDRFIPRAGVHGPQTFQPQPANDPRVTVQLGDIFQSPVDCVVSPANSFGWMDGGIDAIYVARMGKVVEQRVQAEIVKLPFGELLVGQAICVETGFAAAPNMIAAPTMRIPGLTNATSVFLAARAAFALARAKGFATLAMPGLGTWSGCVPPYDAAIAMYEAWRGVMGQP